MKRSSCFWVLHKWWLFADTLITMDKHKFCHASKGHKQMCNSKRRISTRCHSFRRSTWHQGTRQCVHKMCEKWSDWIAITKLMSFSLLRQASILCATLKKDCFIKKLRQTEKDQKYKHCKMAVKIEKCSSCVLKGVNNFEIEKKALVSSTQNRFTSVMQTIHTNIQTRILHVLRDV